LQVQCKRRAAGFIPAVLASQVQPTTQEQQLPPFATLFTMRAVFGSRTSKQ
jgi:hypothetical protein